MTGNRDGGMSMSMVERVARRISPSSFEDMAGHNEGQCALCDSRREDARLLARAAIAEMREPTEEMLETSIEHKISGCECCTGFFVSADDARNNHYAMIDEALKG